MILVWWSLVRSSVESEPYPPRSWTRDLHVVCESITLSSHPQLLCRTILGKRLLAEQIVYWICMPHVLRPWLIVLVNLGYSFNVHAWLPLRVAMSQHCEEPWCSFQTLEGRLLIGYYMTLFDVLTYWFSTWSIKASICALVRVLWVWWWLNESSVFNICRKLQSP